VLTIFDIAVSCIVDNPILIHPLTIKEQRQGVIATKKSNAVRGVVQTSKDFKTRGTRDNDDPTLIHPGGIRMKTIQYIGSIQQFLGGSVIPPVGTGQAVLVEVIGKYYCCNMDAISSLESLMS